MLLLLLLALLFKYVLQEVAGMSRLRRDRVEGTLVHGESFVH